MIKIKTENQVMKSRPGLSDEPLDETTDALIKAARDIFELDGLSALSVRKVANTAGCTTMQVYSRFGGKDGIVQILFNDGFQLLAEAQNAVPSELPPDLRVAKLCLTYLRIARENPKHYALMLGGHSDDFSPSRESGAKAMATLSYLIEAVELAIPQTGDGGKLATRIGHQILAICHGWVTLGAAGLHDGLSDDCVEEAVFALINNAKAGL